MNDKKPNYIPGKHMFARWEDVPDKLLEIIDTEVYCEQAPQVEIDNILFSVKPAYYNSSFKLINYVPEPISIAGIAAAKVPDSTDTINTINNTTNTNNNSNNNSNNTVEKSRGSECRPY